MRIGERYGDEIRRRFPRMIRRVSGYGLDALVDPDTLDLTRLVCGSEGTLAVVTRAEFRLHPLPEARALASFEFGSLTAAARGTVALLEEDPSAVELLDDVAIGRARETSAYAGSTRFVQGGPNGELPKGILLVEWSGSEEALDERFAGLEELAREVGATAVTPLRSKAEHGPDGQASQVHPAVAARHDGPGEAGRLRGGRGGSPAEARRVHRPLRGDRRGERHVGLLLRARQRRVPARQAGRGHDRPRRRLRGCGASPRRSRTSWPSATVRSRASTATASPARSSWRRCTGARSWTPSAR